MFGCDWKSVCVFVFLVVLSVIVQRSLGKNAQLNCVPEINLELLTVMVMSYEGVLKYFILLLFAVHFKLN